MSGIPTWAQWIQALGPVALGAVTLVATGLSLWVSYRQSRISETQASISAEQARLATNKLRLDLYEKRRDVYVQFVSMLSHILMSVKPDRDELFRYEHMIRQHRWLFGREVAEKLEEVMRKAIKLRAVASRIQSNQVADLDAALDLSEELMTWFSEQRLELDRLFEPYLRLDQT